MGLPVKKFICASNSNNVLTDFINTGTYDRNREFHRTISPSMDILVSSNLERLLYEKTEHNSEKINEWMDALQEKGAYSIGRDIQDAVVSDFFGAWIDESKPRKQLVMSSITMAMSLIPIQLLPIRPYRSIAS